VDARGDVIMIAAVWHPARHSVMTNDDEWSRSPPSLAIVGSVRRLWLFLLLAGCGRISFAPATDAAGADSASEGAPADAPASPQWQLIQSVTATGSPLIMAPSGSHHLIVVAAQLGSAGSVLSMTDNASNGNPGQEPNAYVAIPGARAININPNLSDAVELWYVADSRLGASTIRIAATTTVVAAVAWEVSGIRTVDPLDTASKLEAQPATTTPHGPPITTSAAGEFVVSVAIVANGVTGTDASNEFTNDYRTLGNGWAHLTDPMAPAGSHQARWMQNTSGSYCASAAAFQIGP
jgi:hypothetical protein